MPGKLGCARLLDRLASALGLPGVAEIQHNDPVCRMVAAGDNALRSIIAESSTNSLIRVRQRAAEMELRTPGYTAELNRQRALVGLPPV